VNVAQAELNGEAARLPPMKAVDESGETEKAQKS